MNSFPYPHTEAFYQVFSEHLFCVSGTELSVRNKDKGHISWLQGAYCLVRDRQENEYVAELQTHVLVLSEHSIHSRRKDRKKHQKRLPGKAGPYIESWKMDGS